MGQQQDQGWATTVPGCVVQVGCEVRIRTDFAEGVVAIVPAGDEGLYRLTPRTPLGGALLGHGVGELVRVSVDAGTVAFTVLAVEPGRPTMSPDGGVAEQADAAVLKTAHSEGPSSSLGAPTTWASKRRRPAGETGRGRQPLTAIAWLARLRLGWVPGRTA